MRRILSALLFAAIAGAAFIAPQAIAQDKVKMGLFIASSAMPYFIARERGSAE